MAEKESYPERESELCQETLSPRTHMTDENPRLGAVKCSQCCLNQFSHLQDSGPHSPLTTRNRSPPLSIVKQFVHDDRPTQSQQTQFKSTDFEKTTVVLVNNKKIIDVIFRRTELFQHTDVFAGSPCGVDGDVECLGFVEEERKFREDRFRVFLNGRFQVFVGVGSSELCAHVSGDQRTVLNDVFECSTHGALAL